MDHIILVLQQNRLRWYGHVLQKEDTDWVKKCMEYEVEDSRPRGRPKEDLKWGCNKIVKHVNRAGRMLWIGVVGRLDDDEDGGWVNVSSGTSSPGKSRRKDPKTVVVVVVVVVAAAAAAAAVVVVAVVCRWFNDSQFVWQLISMSCTFALPIHRVKWRHISVVAMRSPFCRSTRHTVCS